MRGVVRVGGCDVSSTGGDNQQEYICQNWLRLKCAMRTGHSLSTGARVPDTVHRHGAAHTRKGDWRRQTNKKCCHLLTSSHRCRCQTRQMFILHLLKRRHLSTATVDVGGTLRLQGRCYNTPRALRAI